jgi:hypothetical protein
MTRDMNQVKSAIRALEGHLTAGGGTMTGNGLVWGWRAISQEWASFWNGGFPVKSFEGSNATLIVLTDGIDEMFLAKPISPDKTQGFTPSGYGMPEERRLGVGPLKRTEQLAADYFKVPVDDPSLPAMVKDGEDAFAQYIWDTVGAEEPKIREVLAKRLLETCANAKAKGVTIYTITLGITNADGHPVKKCATSPAHYFDAINGPSLDNTFRKIAGSMKLAQGVRLVR